MASTVNIALTSYPKRITNCVRVINSVLDNTLVPDRVYLTLSHLEFPNYEKDLPDDLYRLVMTSNRVILNWVEENRKSFKKVFPILPYLDEEDVIITIDDDMLLPKDFIQSRMDDFNFNGGQYPISSNLHKTVNIDSLVVSCYSLFQKRMLNGYERFVDDAVFNTCNDDRTYLYLCYFNGFKFMPCTKYCVGGSNGTVKELPIAPHDNYSYVAGPAYDRAVEKNVINLSKGKKIQDCFNLFNVDKDEEEAVRQDEYDKMVADWLSKKKSSLVERVERQMGEKDSKKPIDDYTRDLFEFGKENAKHDLVYVLGRGSQHNNLEIKISITSVLKFCNHWVRDIYVIGENPFIHNPRVKHVYVPDLTRGNKDLFCSDEILVTKKTVWEDFAPRCVFEYGQDEKTRARLAEQAKKNPWDVLMLKTLDRFVGNREHIYFYEPHIFAPINKRLFKQMCKEIDYLKNRNVIIMSLWFNWLGLKNVPKRYDHQSVFNQNIPSDFDKARHLTYNDKAFSVKWFRDKLINIVTN